MAGPGQNAPTTLIVCYRLLGWQQFLFLLRVVFFLLRVVLFWRTRHYDPPYFNDCRWRLREESLPVAGGALPVAKKVLPVAVAGPRPCRIRCLCHPHGCWCRWSDIDSHAGRDYWTPVTDLSHQLPSPATPTGFHG
ncbi:hypothetical protein BALAC2494_02060 [Bifidobacterium animalis subsp. lactis CNCM I-2494]|uniref:Uncharacterized protein n=1 Tax=Bifidobacterium animalis subsp. lactis CNCM I-2494 TaxID=1042403 RepID=A0A806FH80_BIFAN|nr:hypothetical protein BALAC2494_02060 [Bifidobacterium animalis subsp. lactis CNCM I-2494]